MKSIFGHDAFSTSINLPPCRILFPSVLILFLLLPGMSMAEVAETSLTGMARMEASGQLDRPANLSLFRNYVSMRLGGAAAAFLERKVLMGEIPREEAVPLFEELAVMQSRWEEPENLVEICETALRVGARTPLILYSYGTGLRLTGRLSEGSAILARIGPESPFHAYAVYAIGQIAAQAGDSKAALEVFQRVRRMSEDRGGSESLAGRSARSQAELLLILGRHAEAAKLFEANLRKGKDPLDRVGMAAAGGDNRPEAVVLPAETIAGWPIRQRILFSLLQGGLSRNRGQFVSAAAHFARAEEDLNASLLLERFPASEPRQQDTTGEFLRLQIDRHRSLRQHLVSRGAEKDLATLRIDTVELLISILFLDDTISRAKRSLHHSPSRAEVPVFSARPIEEIVRRIEQVTLDGVEVDRLVGELARKLDTLQNLAHPIQRYRLLARLEKKQAEIHGLKEKILQGRRAAITGLETGDGATFTGQLRDLGRFLTELDAIRAAAEEVREFTRRHFNIFRQSAEDAKDSTEERTQAMKEALAFDNAWFTALLPTIQGLEEQAQMAPWERKKQELLALRPVIRRQLADVHVAQARVLREKQPSGWQRESWAALARAAMFLSGDQLFPVDRYECATNIGFLLAGGTGRWEPYPGKSAGENERAMIAMLLPVLAAGSQKGERREEALYLLAVLRRMAGDPGAGTAAREFLEKFPSSPLAGDFAVRLGHQALVSGKVAEATALYRTAAEGANPEAAGIARLMRGWVRFQSGDAGGATRELSSPLSDPDFSCGEPLPFEQAVLSLAVRAWKESAVDLLSSYEPVREGKCGGKLLLVALAEAEEKRWEMVRAAAVYDVLAGRFPGDEAALEYEKKSVDALRRAGKEEEALSRALTLKEKYGPGSSWAKSRPRPMREKARVELAGMLKSLSERRFDEGIRSGERSAMKSAAAGMEQYFALREGEPADADEELRLKWAIASLHAGDRDTGIGLLLELVGERRTDPIGERAAILYAEAMIAGFERREETADDAENSTLLLLGDFPSEKAASLTCRAASAFLASGEYERAGRTAGEVENAKSIPKPLLHEARLVQAEASLFMNDLASARSKAISVLEDAAKEPEPRFRDRARDLYLLASLKEVEAKTAAGDWNRAAALLEEMGGRFPDAPEAPMYGLRAMRSYRLGGDKEGTLRVGERFLQKFYGRDETVEVAGTIGFYLEERNEHLKAGDLYAGIAERFPKSEQAPRFLFRAARLSVDHGSPEVARRRFSAYRAKYSNPRWMTAYATISVGLLAWKGGDARTAIREMEEGLRHAETGVEADAPDELRELAGNAQIAIGEHWAEQFRKMSLVAPLEKNLAVKDRLFRKSLAAFEKAERGTSLPVALNASRQSGELLVEFGRSILASQRPKGMNVEERAKYEEALAARARTYFERAADWFSAALDRLEAGKGPSDLAPPILQRLEEVQTLLTKLFPASEEK